MKVSLFLSFYLTKRERKLEKKQQKRMYIEQQAYCLLTLTLKLEQIIYNQLILSLLPFHLPIAYCHCHCHCLSL